MYSGAASGGGAAALFSGGGFMPSQATQTPQPGAVKSRSLQAVIPVTIKQIREAIEAGDGRSGFVVDGVELSLVKLVGRVVNISERVTDFSIDLDDFTGAIEVKRWVNDTYDTNEMTIIKNGMYVTIHANIKAFQGKPNITALTVRPVTDFNDITLHFLECIYVHLANTKPKVNSAPADMARGTYTPVKNEVNNYQSSASHQFTGRQDFSTGSTTDVIQMVLNVYNEPRNLAKEHGLMIDEVVSQLRLPLDKIKDAIAYLVDAGNIYETIDERHHKSSCNG